MKLLSGNISKRKYLIIIIITLVLIAFFAIIYLLFGFKFFISNTKIDNSDVNLSKNERFQLSSKEFKTSQLPFYINLNNIKLDSADYKKLSVDEVKLYFNDFDENYNYFAVSKFNINKNNTAHIFLKTPFKANFEYSYFLRIYNNQGQLRGHMKLAEFSGDKNQLNITEAKIHKDLTIITMLKKATIINADSLSIINVAKPIKYKIKADGTISLSDTSFK